LLSSLVSSGLLVNFPKHLVIVLVDMQVGLLQRAQLFEGNAHVLKCRVNQKLM